MRNASGAGRAVAVAAIVLALLAVGYVLLKPGGPDYKVHALFQNASQLVKGDFVQVAGAPIGKITNIATYPLPGIPAFRQGKSVRLIACGDQEGSSPV